jgi:hypothetical protein
MAEPPEGWPALLGISFPKSGTHLLDQILLGFSKVAPFSRRLHSFYAEYEGESGRRRSPEQATAWLICWVLETWLPLTCLPGEVVERVASTAFIPYFIFAIRATWLSACFYVTEMETRHVHHAYYASLPDFDARLRVSILGRPGLDIEFPNIAERFAPYMAWLDRPEVTKLHFEDLVHDRIRTLGAILDRFLERVPLSQPRGMILESLEAAINPRRSPTYRSGKTGEWKRYFTAEHTRLFKSVAGSLLQELGYESGNAW